jgi:ABC-type glycerol-3-phosphate transport system substrate-binding protein
MSFRVKRSVVAGITAALALALGATSSPALPKDDDTVEITIFYTGDEYGYLEPCG